MKKKLSLLLSMVLVIGLLAACGNANNSNSSNSSSNNTSGEASEAPAKDLKIAMVLPEQIGVNPFFELMDKGLKQASEEFGVEVKTIESTDPTIFEQNFRTAVAEGYDLVITATYQAEDALNKLAVENPDMSFAVVDTVVDQPNVRSVAFREHEAAFLLGAAAGLITETNKVGNVVAMDIPLMKKYTGGFEQGLAYTNSEAEVIVNFVNSYVDTAKGKELALQQYQQGADFVAGMSAVSDFGVFEAAKEKGLYTSGQDVDRTVLDPEHIILSQLKGADTVTYETVKDFVEGNFTFETMEYGVAEGGVGLTFVTNESASTLSPVIGEENLTKLKAIADDIKSGAIVVDNPIAAQ